MSNPNKKNGQAVKITGSGIVTTANKAGRLRGYNLVGGTTASSVKFLDGGSGGTERWGGTTPTGTNIGDNSKSEQFADGGPIFSTDIYATLSGTGAYVYVFYDEIGD